MNVGTVSIERANSSHVDGILTLATIQKLPSIVASRGERVVGFLLTWEKGKSGNACVNAMLEAYPGSSDAYVYGPICVDASVRGLGIAGKMFED